MNLSKEAAAIFSAMAILAIAPAERMRLLTSRTWKMTPGTMARYSRKNNASVCNNHSSNFLTYSYLGAYHRAEIFEKRPPRYGRGTGEEEVKNFIKLAMLVDVAKQRGFWLALHYGRSGTDVMLYETTPPGKDLGEPLLHYLNKADHELKQVADEVLDHLAGKVLTDGQHSCVVVKEKIFSVTKKDDALYVWTSDEIAEQLSDSVLWEIENKFEGESDV